MNTEGSSRTPADTGCRRETRSALAKREKKTEPRTRRLKAEAKNMPRMKNDWRFEGEMKPKRATRSHRRLANEEATASLLTVAMGLFLRRSLSAKIDTKSSASKAGRISDSVSSRPSG